MDMLVRAGTDEELVKRMVRWLMQVRKKGRWGNTQENAWAMEALVDYYRKYESETPDFTRSSTLGNARSRARAVQGTLDGREEPTTFRWPSCCAIAPPDTQLPVTFTRDGVGTLFYAMRLRYAREHRHARQARSGLLARAHYALQNGKASQTTFKAGDLIKVTLKCGTRRSAASSRSPIRFPAGTEPVESWFATTAAI